MRKFSVPLTGRYNTRISATNDLSGASGVVGIGIVGLMIVGAAPSAVDKDERWINAFMTKEGAFEYYVKRPGLSVNNTPAAGNVGSAILVWSGSGGGTDVITAFGSTNSTVYNATTSLGAITGVARSIAETFVSTTPTLLVPSTDSTAWYYDTGVAVMTRITDADFPGNAGKTTVGDFAVIDGFSCIMTSDGLLYASDLNSVTGWTSNSFQAVNSYPDKGIGCVRFKTYIMAFGANSVQFFFNAGLTTFPLANIDSMTMKIGAISSTAIATLADNVFWCGATDQGGLSIFQYDGSLSRISTPEQDFQLVLAGPTNISLTTLRFYGRSFVLVKANSTTYVYVLEDKRWHEWTSTTPLWYKCAGLSTGSQILTYSISNVSTTGSVFLVNPAALVFQDAGVAFTASIQSANMDLDSPYSKFWNELSIDCDIEEDESLLVISYSDDDYQTFTVHDTLDLSLPKPKTQSLGMSERQRAWKFTNSSNAAFRIRKIEGTATIGTA